MDFSRTLRTLDAGDRHPGAWLFLTILVLGGLWTAWLGAGRVGVYVSTPSARLEVDGENHPVDTLVAGRLAVMHAKVGQRVRAGDILAEFEATSERLARREQQSRMTPASSQAALLREELAAEDRALAEDRSAAEATAAQAEAESQRAQAAAGFAAEEARRVDELQRRRLISDLEAMRARNVAAERHNEAESAEAAARRAVRDTETRRQDRLSRIARLKHDIAAIEGTRAQAAAAAATLGYAIDQRSIRAPIDGTVADVTALTPSSVVAAGSRICTIVPDGRLRVVAYFAPSPSLGRIRVGQPARLRLDGFSWTEYGMPKAHVSSVSGESQDGRVRVELSLDVSDSTIPLQHGLPAEVDVEVERVSPATLVMRGIGARTRLSASDGR